MLKIIKIILILPWLVIMAIKDKIVPPDFDGYYKDTKNKRRKK